MKMVDSVQGIEEGLGSELLARLGLQKKKRAGRQVKLCRQKPGFREVIRLNDYKLKRLNFF